MNDKQAVAAGQSRGDETFNKVDSFTLVGREIANTGGRGLMNDAGRIGDWCQTWTGTRFYPLDPRPEDVKLPDVLIGLGNMARYNGQTRRYSVAEHTILCSMLVEQLPVGTIVPEDLQKWCREELAYMALHHDDPEYLMADMTRPFKRAIGRDNDYFKLEEQIWKKAIAPRFKLPEVLPQSILNVDVAVLGLEKKVLCPRSDPWELPFPVPKGIMIRCLEPQEASLAWLRRHCELTGEAYWPLHDEFIALVIQDAENFYRCQREQMIDMRKAA